MPGAGPILDPTCPLTNHPLNRGLLVRMRVTRNSGWRGGLTWRDLRRGQHRPNDGTLFGGRGTGFDWQGGPPWSDGSVNFNGSTGYSDNTSFANQPQGNVPVSMSAWVRFTNSASRIEIVSFFGKDIAGGNQSYFIYRNAGGKAESEFGSSTGPVIGGTTLVANVWYWLCAVYTGTTNSIFVNGISDATPFSYSAANFANTEHVVGAYRLSNGSIPNLPLAGNVDDVCIWDHALSSPYAIYQEQKAGSPNTINWLDNQQYPAAFGAPAVATAKTPWPLLMNPPLQAL